MLSAVCRCIEVRQWIGRTLTLAELASWAPMKPLFVSKFDLRPCFERTEGARRLICTVSGLNADLEWQLPHRQC